MFEITKRGGHIYDYTNTLENVYNISNNHICHIHGISSSINNANNSVSNEIIFGHGRESFDTNVVDLISTAYNIIKKPLISV